MEAKRIAVSSGECVVLDGAVDAADGVQPDPESTLHTFWNQQNAYGPWSASDSASYAGLGRYVSSKGRADPHPEKLLGIHE
jgi:hypothetical protein